MRCDFKDQRKRRKCGKTKFVTKICSATDPKMVWDEFISTFFILMACSGVDLGFSRGGGRIFENFSKNLVEFLSRPK